MWFQQPGKYVRPRPQHRLKFDMRALCSASAAASAFNFASKQFELYDQRLDSLHSKFAKDFEDLDLQIVTDKNAFRNYLSTLTYAEEYYFISRKLKKIHDSIGSGRK